MSLSTMHRVLLSDWRQTLPDWIQSPAARWTGGGGITGASAAIDAPTSSPHVHYNPQDCCCVIGTIIPWLSVSIIICDCQQTVLYRVVQSACMLEGGCGVTGGTAAVLKVK